MLQSAVHRRVALQLLFEGGESIVLSILQNYVSSFKGKTANLSETFTNEFANKAS